MYSRGNRVSRVKRAPKSRAKGSLKFPSPKVSGGMSAAAELVVLDCLRAWLADKVPLAATEIDIRKISDPRWARFVMHFGTAGKLAAFLGVSEMTIGRWVKGESKPDKFSELLLQALAGACELQSPV